MTNRRKLLTGAAAIAVLGGASLFGRRESMAANGEFEISLSEAEWREREERTRGGSVTPRRGLGHPRAASL